MLVFNIVSGFRLKTCLFEVAKHCLLVVFVLNDSFVRVFELVDELLKFGHIHGKVRRIVSVFVCQIVVHIGLR